MWVTFFFSSFEVLRLLTFIKFTAVFSLDQEHKDHPLKNLYVHSKVLFDFIGPHEYGIEVEEKFEIAMLNSLALLRQIVDDLSATTISSKPCTRMYFTKESKVICLLNIVLLCGMPSVISRNDVDELDCMFSLLFLLQQLLTTNHFYLKKQT